MNQAFRQILENQITIMKELGYAKEILIKGCITDEYNDELLKRIESTEKLLKQRI